MSQIRVLLVDDHTVMRRGFALMLQAEPDIVVVGEAADGAAAVRQARALSPDVVLMDVQMPGVDGIKATEQVTEAGLAQVVILTAFDDDEALFSGLSAGAAGYLLKNADPVEIAEAIRQVHRGHGQLAPEVTRRVLARLPHQERGTAPSADLDSLTGREREVLRLVAQGRTNQEIAEELIVGVTTVKSYLSACLAKLHARDRVQLVVLAYELGLVRPGEGGSPS
ncbi:DNA-binding response regulator [Actinomyces lilanjuaniae]|uniref:DNA-binding response regulator n=1 Tax=Actinomyces lilanjuaniae TaxID=2321394 RepID=A0ABM6Z4X2_9ACTO|nr:response regulator transcription factor [Actinomyces lilanjuaniae]AYD89975.1 DNA-binding response regulator [Actinomyces lilanjuaniae]